MAAALAVSSHDSQEHEQDSQHAFRLGRTAGNCEQRVCARRRRAGPSCGGVLGGRYSTELGIDVMAERRRWSGGS
jgi:hypothetical protein